jgi:formylglycine-generating enzyme required for sulfatase activity
VALPSDGSCDPAAHPLVNATIVEAPGENGCPPGMLRIDTFCIDRWEAHLVTFPAGDPVSPYFEPASPVMARSAQGAVPQGYISQVQATAACANAGKRLCTDSEWLRACQGPNGTTYPYGDTLMEGVCNDHREQHPVIEYFMTSEDWIWSELAHPCLNQLDAGLATSGAYAGCESSEGAFDLMGNLHEWTDNPQGTFRGGFYVDTVLNGSGCLYATTAHDVTHLDYSTGFRCCAD